MLSPEHRTTNLVDRCEPQVTMHRLMQLWTRVMWLNYTLVADDPSYLSAVATISTVQRRGFENPYVHGILSCGAWTSDVDVMVGTC